MCNMCVFAQVRWLNLCVAKAKMMLQTRIKALFEWGLSHFDGKGAGATPTVAPVPPTVRNATPSPTANFKVQAVETPTQSLKIPFNPASLPSATHPVVSQNPRDIETLRAIMKALRTPVSGCPWDLEQNFKTIAPYTIEEAYEVADAIERGSMADLCDELGDLLLQPIYHAQMATEAGEFTFDDVIEAVVTKMIRRHPHVFGDAAAKASGVSKGFWEENKAKERSSKGQHSEATLNGVALALPGLTRAVKLQSKAAKVGFDWPSVDNVYDKVAEEIAEFREAPADQKTEEFGDLLFALANVARHLGIDPEAAVRSTNAKFERRFAFIEAELAKLGKGPKQSNLEEMDALWDKAKLAER